MGRIDHLYRVVIWVSGTIYSHRYLKEYRSVFPVAPIPSDEQNREGSYKVLTDRHLQRLVRPDRKAAIHPTGCRRARWPQQPRSTTRRPLRRPRKAIEKKCRQS